jgi:hypothetical protein
VYWQRSEFSLFRLINITYLEKPQLPQHVVKPLGEMAFKYGIWFLITATHKRDDKKHQAPEAEHLKNATFERKGIVKSQNLMKMYMNLKLHETQINSCLTCENNGLSYGFKSMKSGDM